MISIKNHLILLLVVVGLISCGVNVESIMMILLQEKGLPMI